MDSSVVDETDSVSVVFFPKFVVSILNLQSEVEVTQSDEEDRDLKYPVVVRLLLTSVEEETAHCAILFSLFSPSSLS